MARSVINVLVNADTRRFTSGMDTAGRRVSRFATNSVRNIGRIGLAFGAAGAAGAVAFGKAAFDAAEAASTSNARIGQVAEQMGLFGGAADDVSAKLIGQAESMAKLTGVNQNTIKEGQALLLTFGNIAESADDVGGAFDRANQLTVDLAAAGFGSVTDNAKQLGKALNDPVAGLSALSRSGLTFSEDQKEVIRSLVETGDIAGAQNLILAELEKQVGGTAEATANASDKIKVGFSQIMERVGTALLPVFERLTDFVLDRMIPAIDHLVDVFREDGLRGVLDMLIGHVETAGPKALGALASFTQSMAQWFVSTGLPFLAKKAMILGEALVEWIGPRIDPALRQLGEWIQAAARWFVDDALPVILEKLQVMGEALVDWIGPRVQPALQALGDWISTIANWIIETGVPTAVDKLIELGNAFVDWIEPRLPDLIRELGNLLGRIVSWVASTAVPGLIQANVKLGNAMVGWALQLFPRVLEGLSALLTDIVHWGANVAAPRLVQLGGQLARGLRDGIVDLLSAAWSGASGFAKSIVNGIIGFINTQIIDRVNSMLEFTVNYGLGSFTVNPPDIGRIPQLAQGGIVKSPTLALIGEAGPEAVVPLSGRNAPNVGGPVNITINMPAGSDGNDVVRTLQRHARRTGSIGIPTNSLVRQ